MTGCRKSDRFTFVRGCAIPVPAAPRYVIALTSALAAGLAAIASMTCCAVLDRSPSASVASVTRTSLPIAETISGELAAAGSRSSAVTLLPPWWPHAREVRTTALVAELPAAVLPEPDSPEKTGAFAA